MTDEYHNPFISDAVQRVNKATESANKNLDNALEVAVDALIKAREEVGKIKNNECPCGKLHVWFEIDNALQTISRILKVKQKD